MTGDQYERNHEVAPRHPVMRWVVAVAVLAIVIVGVGYLQESSSGRNLPSGGTQDDRVGALQQPGAGAASTPSPRPQGTAGTTEPAAVDSPAVIKELDTITGTNDGHELVGRKVSLHVPVQGMANDVAFWVGEKDNRLLVVIDRDHRNTVQRQDGELAGNNIAPVHSGQQADISGTIEKVPTAEQMYSWSLTTEDKRELAERPIYIRAESVTAEGE